MWKNFLVCLISIFPLLQSVQHENTYRNPQAKYCYGESPPELLPVWAYLTCFWCLVIEEQWNSNWQIRVFVEEMVHMKCLDNFAILWQRDEGMQDQPQKGQNAVCFFFSSFLKLFTLHKCIIRFIRSSVMIIRSI